MKDYKKLVIKLLNNKYGKVSVTRGRGTGHSWLRITTERKIPLDIKYSIEKELVNHGYCGTYLMDHPGITERDANVNWEEYR